MRKIDKRPHRISAMIAASLAIACLASGGVRAETPKPVTVVNEPTVQAQQSGPWSVSVLNDLNPAIQPYQVSHGLFIDFPDDTWEWTFAVPPGKLLIIEYVSGSFTKKIGGSTDPSQPPYLFTVATTAGGNFASHVIPVRGIYDFAGAQSWFQIAQSLRLYADGGTNVTVRLHHLFTAGFQADGSVRLAGRLQDAP